MKNEDVEAMEKVDLRMLEPQPANKKWFFKVVLLGSNKSGKTKLLERFVESIYNDTYTETIGVDFTSKAIVIGNSSITFQFWDTAGASRFNNLLGNYLYDMHAVFVVFDASKPLSTHENVKFWCDLAEVEFKKKSNYGPHSIEGRPLFVIIANKTDTKVNEETLAEGRRVAGEVNALFYQISVKQDIESIDVDNMMVDVAKELTSRFHNDVNSHGKLRFHNGDGDYLNDVTKLQNENASEHKSSWWSAMCCCCSW